MAENKYSGSFIGAPGLHRGVLRVAAAAARAGEETFAFGVALVDHVWLSAWFRDVTRAAAHQLLKRVALKKLRVVSLALQPVGHV